MHNLDLLRASVPHHPDGRPKDPHAHHRATHLAVRHAVLRARLAGWLARLLARPVLHQPSLRVPSPAVRR